MAEFRRVFRVQGMDTDASPAFQMVPNGGVRYVALHDGAGMIVATSDPGICALTEITEASLPADDRATGATAAAKGDRFFKLEGNAKGVAALAAVNLTALPVFLEIGVKDRLIQRIKFYSVRDNAGHASVRPLAIAGSWLPSFNYIWKRQANVELVRHGGLDRLPMSRDMGDPIMMPASGLGPDGGEIADSGDNTADLKVFFVWEIQRPTPGRDTNGTTRDIGSAHSGGPGAVLFEDHAGGANDAMLAMAHEIGHHMGLEHSEINTKNLMWPTNGERGLNLTKEQVNIANP